MTRQILTFRKYDFFGNIIVAQRPVEREAYSVDEKMDYCREMQASGYELESIHTEVLEAV